MTTQYEIVAEKEGQRFLIGYAVRTSRSGLLDAMRNVGMAMIEKLSIGYDEEISWDFDLQRRACATITNGWSIRFSGRTRHEARHLGELPFIAAASS